MVASLALAAFVVGAAVAPPSPGDVRRDQARDTGRTFRHVEELRRIGEYQMAEDELRGYLLRWQTFGLDSALIAADCERVRELLSRIVEIREHYQAAPYDKREAAAYLRALVDPARPSTITEERARGIALLARHDPALRALIERAFSARLEMSVHSEPDMELNEHAGILFQNALVDMSRPVGLPVVVDAGEGSGAVLKVEMFIRENDRANSLLAGTLMRSYAVHMTARLVDATGERVLDAATTTAVLGINPGNAAKWGMSKCAERIYERIVDELAKRIERGEL